MRRLQRSLEPEQRCEQIEDRENEHRREALADLSRKMRKAERKPMKYKAWFKIVNEPQWCTAAKEWDTEEEATAHALGKFRAWSATEDWTVRKLGENPNGKETR